MAYQSRELLRRQHFFYDEWPGGLYGSGTTAGTRPAAPIAGAWAAITHLGVAGYLRMAETVRDTTVRFMDGIDAIEGIVVAPRPDAAALQIAAAEGGPDLAAVGDVMEDRGWALDRQQGGLHLMVSPYHARIVDPFLADLAEAVAQHGPSRGIGATYGGVA